MPFSDNRPKHSLRHRLQSSALAVIKRVVQQKDLFPIDPRGPKVATELREGPRRQRSAKKCPQVFPAEVHRNSGRA